VLHQQHRREIKHYDVWLGPGKHEVLAVLPAEAEIETRKPE
jgi:hypothetical protein